jgi:hypothetical protein
MTAVGIINFRHDMINRAARWIQAYDGQGIHRSTSPADERSAEWLASEAAEGGAHVQIDEFPFERVEPIASYVEVDGIRIAGQPLFDSPFTSAEGMDGTLGHLGSNARIGLAEYSPHAALGGQEIPLEREMRRIGPHLIGAGHWRFTPEVAAEIIAPLRECGVTWYECPIAETEEHIADLRQLRHLANNAGMVLAGLEQGIGSARFETFARAGTYDIMMPDIKYIGGIDIMVETATILARYGVTLSPHNPTGPICHAVSLAVCGALDRVGLLEMQFDETPVFDRLVSCKLASPIAGHVSVPTNPGLGVLLNRQALAVLPNHVVAID